MRQNRQRLLEIGDRLPIGRSRHRFGARLTEVHERLLPNLAPERVMGQAVNLFAEAIGIERLDSWTCPGFVER